MQAFTIALILLGLLPACFTTSGSSGVLSQPPSDFSSFESLVYVGRVGAQARFYSDHEKIFGVDLIEKYGIVPVALQIWVTNAQDESGRARISPDDMGLRLYLQDGTALAALDYRALPVRDEEVLGHVASEALKAAPLLPHNESKERMVFFKIDNPGDYKWENGPVARHEKDNMQYTIDLTKSLCAFNVTIDLKLQPVYVGLDLDSRNGGHK
jgi:hypothetical protein